MAIKQKKDSPEALFNELFLIENIDDRKKKIFDDISKERPRYKQIAESDSLRFFELLGGKKSNVTRTHNWAFQFTYKDYIEQSGDDFDKEAEKDWDIEEKSIQYANDTGDYYVTGLYIIKGEKNLVLPFEFEYCEGYLNGIIGTPYNTPQKGNIHGVLFS